MAKLRTNISAYEVVIVKRASTIVKPVLSQRGIIANSKNRRQMTFKMQGHNDPGRTSRYNQPYCAIIRRGEALLAKLHISRDVNILLVIS